MSFRQGEVSRRGFIKAAALAAGGAGALALLGEPGTAAGRGRKQSLGQHLSWVWTFTEDGPKEGIRATLAGHGVGILLKTHDGTNWMSRFDRGPDAISGPEQVRNLVRYFEGAGVPFHAWCVLKGLEPLLEARMAAEVIAAGARSIYLDLEPSDGGLYWQGSPHDAWLFGQEFRRLQPTAWVALAPDCRPWQAAAVPMPEFAAIADEIAPQTYWHTYNSPGNHRLLREYGYHVGPEGVTPELLMDVAVRTFERFQLPIRPIGQGSANGHEWRRFIGHGYGRGVDAVSVWRHGVSDPGVWPVLKEMAPRQIAEAATVQERNRHLAAAAAPASDGVPSSPDPVSAAADPQEETQTISASASFQKTPFMPGSQPEHYGSQRIGSPPGRGRKRLYWDISGLRGDR
jgi:hypothetical protein